MNGRLKKNGNTKFSIVPTTLPHGCITVHSMQDSDCCAFHCGKFTGHKSNCTTSSDSNNYNVKEVHYLRQDDHIIDHCWTSIVIPFYSVTNDQSNNKKTDFVFSVLAVLTRISSFQNDEKRAANETIAKTQNDDEDINFRKSGYSKPETQSHYGSVVSIYCRLNPNDEAYFLTDSGNKFMLIKEIKFRSFPYSLELNSKALIVAGPSGAEIYSLRRILFESTSFLQTWSDLEMRPLAIFESKQDSGNFSDDKDSSQNENDRKYDLNSKEKDCYKLVNNKLHLMVSFPIHAVKICSPFMAAASGGQIGVWNINTIIFYLENEIMDNETACDDSHKKNGVNRKLKDIKTAFWSTFVERCQERINCIDFTPTYLALSCWDGTAFVFYPERELKTENYNANYVEKYLERCAIDKSAGPTHESIFRQTSSWVQYNPMKSSPFNKFISSSIAKADTNKVTYSIPEWEISPLKGTDRQKTENTPTFLSISDFFNIRLQVYPLHYYFDDLSWITNHFLAISTPGSSIIRCFDLKTGRRCYDLNNSNNLNISDLLVDGEIVSKKKMKPRIFPNLFHMFTENVLGGNVDGMISKSFDPLKMNQIYWLDHENTIHNRIWPHWCPSEVDRRNSFRNLLHCKEIFVTHIRFADISLVQSKIRYDLDALLLFYRKENIWKLNLRKPNSTNEYNQTKYVIEGLPLPFLTDDDVMDLIIRSNKCSQKNYNNYMIKNADESSCSAIAFEGYLGFVIPSIQSIYLHHLDTNEWRILHIDDQPKTNEKKFTDKLANQPNEIIADSNSIFSPKLMKIWFLGSHIIVIVSFSPNNHISLQCMQATIWNISHCSPIFIGSKKMMFPDNFDLNDDIQALHRKLFDSIQVHLYDNSSTPYLIFFCQHLSMIRGNNQKKDFGTIISWNLKWNDPHSNNIKPKKNDIESLLHSEASMS